MKDDDDDGDDDDDADDEKDNDDDDDNDHDVAVPALRDHRPPNGLSSPSPVHSWSIETARPSNGLSSSMSE